MATLIDQLLDEEEGNRAFAYRDSRGYISIGRGVCVDERVPGAVLSPSALAYINGIKLNEAQVRARALQGFASLNEVRQAVVISMCYQLGELASWTGFKAALAAGDYAAAANAMLFEKDGVTWTLWRKQTTRRCEREARMMQSGLWEPRT